MSDEQYIMAIDQGTTSSRAIIFDHQGHEIAMAQQEFPQYFPNPGWVEHDATEIWDSVQSVISDVMIKSQIKPYCRDWDYQPAGNDGHLGSPHWQANLPCDRLAV